MAKVYDPLSNGLGVAAALVGGGLGGAVTLGVLALVATVRGGTPWVPVNALGAWLIRWLHTTDTLAVRGFYADAAVAGCLTAVASGGLLAALLAIVLRRTSLLGPQTGGVLAGLLAAVAGCWLLAPAVNPLLTDDLPGLAFRAAAEPHWPGRVVQSLAWLAAGLLYGGLVGWWFRTEGHIVATGTEARGTSGEHEV